jgi:hypothetical protein
MKKMVFIFIIFFSSFALAETEEPNAIKEMRIAIGQLDRETTNLLKIIELQKKEIDYLRKLCSEAGIDVTPLPVGICKPIFGIHLGETLQALRSRLKVLKSDYVFADKNYPGQVWSVENNDPNIKSLSAYTFNEKIYEIDVEFADANAANCQAINAQLRKDYQTIYQNTFETMNNGVNVGIELNCHIGKNNRLISTYIHVPILRDIYNELGKQRINKAAGESQISD